MAAKLENQFAKHVIGLDLGGTKLAASLFSVDENGALAHARSLKPLGYAELLGDERKKPPPPVAGEMIKNSMLRMIGELSAGAGGVSAVGIASAGFVEGKTIADASNVGIKMYPLGEKIEKEAGIRTFLYKDSWAPVFAVAPPEPAIIFSVGTGFGGVSCEPGMKIKILGRTVRRRPIWLPALKKNDDPGYAVAFSQQEVGEIFSAAAGRSGEKALIDADAKNIAKQLQREAVRRGKTVPGLPMYLAAKVLAPEVVSGWEPGEVFADFPGCASFPPFLYKLLTGKSVSPREHDGILASGDAAAAGCALAQAEFIARIIIEMQRERVDFGLPPAGRVYATGSGYNDITHRFLGGAIIEVCGRLAEEEGLPPPRPERVEPVAPPHPDTTLTAAGAAMGAWRGIKIQVASSR